MKKSMKLSCGAAVIALMIPTLGRAIPQWSGALPHHSKEIFPESSVVGDKKDLPLKKASTQACRAETPLSRAIAGTVSLPYRQTFDAAGSVDSLTVINSNGDTNTWQYYSSGNIGQIRVKWNTSQAMDDWAILPGMELKAGRKYRFSGWFRAHNASNVEKFEIKAGNSATAEGMTLQIIPTTEVTNSAYETYAAEFQVPESGIWYVGVHGC